MNPHSLRVLCGLALACLAAGPVCAAEINGTVRSATPEYATVTTESDLIPAPGDTAEIFFKLPGADVEISVASGHVYEITGSNIMVKIHKATGAVTKDQLVRITSPNPKKKATRTAPGPTASLPVATAITAPPQMGTWKLNEAKSEFASGAAKNNKVVWKAAGDSVKITVDGTGADGKPAHNEWTGKLDGKDYPVTGDPSSDARSFEKVDDRTLELTVKKDGKVIVTGRIVVSADDKSRTVTTSGTNAKVKNTAVYDKQ